MLSLSLLALSYTIPPLGNVLNVKDFGAKGDGTTDDGVLDDATITVADSDATIVGSAFRETDKSVTIQESVGGSTKTAAGADTSTFPSRALFDFDEPSKDPTGVVSQTGIHVPFFRSGTSKNWYYAARAA